VAILAFCTMTYFHCFSLHMCRKVYLGAAGKKYASVRFLDLNFLIGSHLRTFPVDFLSDKLKVRHISTSGLFELESVQLEETPTMIISTKFEVDITACRRVTALLVWPFTFWFWTVIIRCRSCDQFRHQIWRPYAYPFLTYELWCLP